MLASRSLLDTISLDACDPDSVVLNFGVVSDPAGVAVDLCGTLEAPCSGSAADAPPPVVVSGGEMGSYWHVIGLNRCVPLIHACARVLLPVLVRFTLFGLGYVCRSRLALAILSLFFLIEP